MVDLIELMHDGIGATVCCSTLYCGHRTQIRHCCCHHSTICMSRQWSALHIDGMSTIFINFPAFSLRKLFLFNGTEYNNGTMCCISVGRRK